MELNQASAPPLENILAQFDFPGTVSAVTPFGSGHIHDTFRVETTGADSPDYVLQRMNHQVFTRIPELMENISRVTAHLRRKLQSEPGADSQRETLTVIPTRTGQLFYFDGTTNYWRLYRLIEKAKSYDVVQTPEQAYQGGRAFGRFGVLLSDFPIQSLHETLPDFHHIGKRLQTLWLTLEQDPVGRAGDVAAEIRFVKERADRMQTILRWGRQGTIPLRVTHNDTKFNNVLLDEWDRALCVVDLDTVMPGYAAYDFGDSIRTTANSAPEDEPDLAKISFNLSLFGAYTQGYLEQMGRFLTDPEIASLVWGCQLMPYLMGVRFLTDYLDGDHYYKIHDPQHNLRRCRAQFRFLEEMEAQTGTMERVIQEVISEKQ